VTTFVITVVMSSSPAKKPVPVYLRGLPAELVRDAKAAAARRGVTLAGYVADCLARARAVGPGQAADEPDRLHDELRWFERARRRLVEQYPGQFVAILDRKVIDHDVEFEALAQRVFAAYGTRDVLMPQLPGAAGAGSKRPLRLRSPRLVRRA